MTKTRAYSYLRVSSKAQAADDKDGFPRQRAAIIAFAAENDIEIVGEFAEKITGRTESMDRPMFRELLDCVQNRRDVGTDLVEVIIVERQDRLARDLLVGELLLETCRKQRLKVYSADQGLVDVATDDTDPTRILIRQIMGALAQWDRSTLVRKLRAGRERSARNKGVARVEGRKAYGELPGEAAAKKLMADWREEGHTFEHIADELNAEGFVDRRGRPWQTSQVWEILNTERKRKERAACGISTQSSI